MKKTLYLLASVLFFTSAQSQTADEYYNRGIAKGKLGDYCKRTKPYFKYTN
jgi:hypothetical protein